ncbi:uncharacterized protein LOC110237659 [Exaiptasia diaphana]|uniref:UPAR/Ly6 domain-containing protein n=1 Tax=Exaiptasia diaphana TaxID=2652724 RepID=A0A913X4Q8_EXADI|nr:uncharacterized protein LOC110237659 [Exaiptasia diaphana]KXJ27128.1 hypothetical protein AC249_AIPGENE13735 [Exaiptasia diaphana]
MRLEALFAVVFLSLVSVGTSLDCYHCSSSESWAMCMRNRYVQECKPGQTRCYKVAVDTYYDDARVTRYTRGCTTDKHCYEETLDDCKGGTNQEHPLQCDVYCCSGELCNASTFPIVSVIFTMTCALFAMLFH